MLQTQPVPKLQDIAAFSAGYSIKQSGPRLADYPQTIFCLPRVSQNMNIGGEEVIRRCAKPR